MIEIIFKSLPDIPHRDFFTNKFHEEFKVFFKDSPQLMHSNMAEYALYNLAKDEWSSVSFPVSSNFFDKVPIEIEKNMVIKLIQTFIISFIHPPLVGLEKMEPEERNKLIKEWHLKYNEIFYQYIDEEKWNNVL